MCLRAYCTGANEVHFTIRTVLKLNTKIDHVGGPKFDLGVVHSRFLKKVVRGILGPHTGLCPGQSLVVTVAEINKRTLNTPIATVWSRIGRNFLKMWGHLCNQGACFRDGKGKNEK